MILPLHERRARVRGDLRRSMASDADSAAIAIEYAAQPRAGRPGQPVAFELARRLRKAPRVIAQELAAALGRSTA